MQTHKITLSYPTSGLTVNVEIRNRTTNAVLESGVAVENGTTATYDYDFDGADDTDYIYIATVTGLNTMRGVVYYEASSGGSGLTTEEHDKLMGISGGGGYVRNVGLDAIDKKYIKETHEKVSKLENTDLTKVQEQLNEIDSQNDIANQNIIDTIKEIEKDICKDINKESIATRQLVRQKAKKQEEYIQKQLDSEAKTQEMIENEADEIEVQIEKNLEIEIEEIEKQINSQIDKEIEEIESNLPNNGNNNGTES